MKIKCSIVLLACLLLVGCACAESVSDLDMERTYLEKQAPRWLGLIIPADAEFGYLSPPLETPGDYMCRYTDPATGQKIQIQVIHAQAPNLPRYELLVQRRNPDGTALPVSDAVGLDFAGKASRFDGCTQACAADFLIAEDIIHSEGMMPDGEGRSRTGDNENEWLWSISMIFGGDGTGEYDRSLVKIYWDPVTDSLCRLLILPIA